MTFTFSELAEMRAEISREIIQRQRTFAKWVQQGTMTEAEATGRLRRLENIVKLIDQVKEGLRS